MNAGTKRLGDLLAFHDAVSGLQAAPWTGTNFC
jgi:hypothetical protein